MDFGRSPWPLPGGESTFGDLIDCDFTQANLDLCRFFSVDIHRQKFAGWPQFVIPYKNELAAAELPRAWPGKLPFYFEVSKQQDPTLSATTGTCSHFMKRQVLTEEELRQVLSDIGGVLS